MKALGEQNMHLLEFGSIQSLDIKKLLLSLLGILQARPGWSSYVNGRQDKQLRVELSTSGSLFGPSGP